ncbi:YtcA family lipoprotein [Orbus mooreae]|uniref:YtcA family lipoprotein n=1 Tax=Orbus mooreae TaxID=3074107 RepID=UPI00370DC107
MKKYLLILLMTVFLTSCKQEGPPVVVFLGSYFPSWIFYFIASIILVLLARILLIKISIDQLINYKPILYISLVAIFAFLFSLLFS